jgi:hypothetical protein
MHYGGTAVVSIGKRVSCFGTAINCFGTPVSFFGTANSSFDTLRHSRGPTFGFRGHARNYVERVSSYSSASPLLGGTTTS